MAGEGVPVGDGVAHRDVPLHRQRHRQEDGRAECDLGQMSTSFIPRPRRGHATIFLAGYSNLLHAIGLSSYPSIMQILLRVLDIRV